MRARIYPRGSLTRLILYLNMHCKLSARLDSQKRSTHTGRLLSYNSIYARAAIICGTSKMNNSRDGSIRKTAALVSAAFIRMNM